MARIILNWLNDEVRLSREITSLSDDFSNGYLLGELLAAYNQQHHFDKFINNDTPDAKIRNYCLLEPTMRQVGVHFNSKVAFDLMNYKPGAMKTLLYELKTVLDNAKEMSMTPDGAQKCVIMQIIRPSKPFYDKTMSSTFENAIRGMVENPNDVLFKKTQTTYDNMSVTFKDSVSTAHSLQLDDIAIEIRRNKELTRQRKRHEKEFQETWHEINMDQWRTNQVVARERRNLQTIVDHRITTRKTHMKKQENLNARNKAISSIDEFEDRLSTMRVKEDPADKTLSIDIRAAGGEEGTGVPELSYMNEETLREGMVKNQKIMQERNEKLRLRRQDHDKRRKRFVRLRESHHSSILHSDADKEIIEQVLVTSQIEDIEQFAKLRFMSHGKMMIQNDKNLHHITELQTTKAADDIEKCKVQESVLEKECVVAHHLAAQAARLSVAEEAKASALRVETKEIAEAELMRILDITDWVVNVRALGVYEGGLEIPAEGVLESEEKILPELLMRDVHAMFACGDIQVPDALPVMNPTNVFDEFPFSLSWRPLSTKTAWLFEDAFRAGKYMRNTNNDCESDESNMACFLNVKDSNSFIQQISDYKAPEVDESEDSGGKKDAKKKEPKKEKDSKKGKKGKEEEVVPESGIKIVTPEWIGQTKSDCLLGETVVSLRCIAEPIPDPPTVPECIPTQQLRVALCGTSATMKSKVAAAISNELGLKVLNVNELMAAAMTAGSDNSGAECKDSEEPSAYAAMSSRIYNNALDGQAVSDDDYVDLLVDAISQLETNGKGFVIENFPNTDEQAFKLVAAVSGIDYNQHRPQPKDKVSKFLTTNHRDEIVFDYEQCGFDHMFFVSSPPLTIVDNRITTREEFLTNEIVSITEETTKVDTLAEVVTPSNPMDTLSFLISNSTQAIGPIFDFANRLGVASLIEVDDDRNVTAAVEKMLLSISPPVSESEVTEVVEEPKEEAQEESQVEVEGGSEEKNEEEVKASDDGDAPIYPPLVLQEGALPPKLAKVLDQMWTAGERQVTTTSVQFFSGLRDAQYQMVQRRGGIRHAVMCSVLRRDNKQDIFDEFREQFNSFKMDFRFDADLINELYLRTLELRDRFWTISEERASQANGTIESISRDSSVNVLIHNCECEGSQLLQMYANLFVAGLNLMMDHMRAVSNYDYKKAVDQTLEEVDPVPEDYLGLANGEEDAGDKKGGKRASQDKGKGKDKGGGGASRVAIACPVLWSEMENSIPQPVPKVEEEVETGKKKPAKEKKGEVEEVAPSPFAKSREKATSFCATYMRESFTVDQEMYGDDEVLAQAIEKAIWHEADRFTHMIDMVSNLVSSQSQWLMDQEHDALDLMKKMVEKRKISELSTTERLCDMIYDCIENNTPIRTQWQIAADVIVDRKERLVYPPPIITETIPMNDFFTTYLNEEQTQLSSDVLQQVLLGNSTILKEDLCEWLNLCNSGIGPVACNFSPKDSFYNVSFPTEWQKKGAELLAQVYTSTAVAGTAEETGVMVLDKVMENLSIFGGRPVVESSDVAPVTEEPLVEKTEQQPVQEESTEVKEESVQEDVENVTTVQSQQDEMQVDESTAV